MNNDMNIIIHYSEIGLKKGNRGFFEHKLKSNIIRALSDLTIGHLKVDFGRFILNVPDGSISSMIVERLKDIPGIAHFSPAFKGDLDVEVLKQQVFDRLKNESFNSFCIKTRRADKAYPLTSVQVNQIVGEKIHTDLKKPVDLHNPELICFIEIFNHKIYFYFQRLKGIRGLPVGSSGKIISLLSSGIDSPGPRFTPLISKPVLRSTSCHSNHTNRESFVA